MKVESGIYGDVDTDELEFNDYYDLDEHWIELILGAIYHRREHKKSTEDDCVVCIEMEHRVHTGEAPSVCKACPIGEPRGRSDYEDWCHFYHELWTYWGNDAAILDEYLDEMERRLLEKYEEDNI